MVARRLLSPRSVWDAEQVRQTFADAGAKESPIPRLYRSAASSLQHQAPWRPESLRPDHCCRYLINNLLARFDEVPDIPRSALALLAKDYVRSTSTVQQCQTSADQQTTKLLIRLQDGLQCEAVIMHYDTTGALSSSSCAALLHPPCS